MDIDAITMLSPGATFFRGDLHIHSYGASYDVRDDTATPENIVNLAIQEKLDLIALTDHNEISNVQTAVDLGTKGGVLVVPGVELSTPEGHLLCYAPSMDALDTFYNRLSLAGRRTSDSRCQTGMFECLNLLHDVHGMAIIAHIELAGSFEANLPRPTRPKLDILCHPALAGIEVTKADCPISYNDSDTDNDRKRLKTLRVEQGDCPPNRAFTRACPSDHQNRPR